MIFITAKFRVLPEHADDWAEISREFTEATRSEEGCLWFEWSRSLDDPHEYVLVEAFRDGDAGGAHVGSDHFKKAQADASAVPRRDAAHRQLRGARHRLVRARRDEGLPLATRAVQALSRELHRLSQATTGSARTVSAAKGRKP